MKIEIHETHDAAIKEFLSEFFDLDGALICEECYLDDFCGRGLSKEQIDSADSYNALCSLWDEYILDKFFQRYGVFLETTHLPLSEVVSRLIKYQRNDFH